MNKLNLSLKFHTKFSYFFFWKQSYFRFLLIYIVINAYIYFLNVKKPLIKVIFHIYAVR